MTRLPSNTPVFGAAPSDVACHLRLAAYGVILDTQGRVAAVRGPAGYWLPGGGMLADETPEATVVREVREELGRSIQQVRRIGEAVQFFHATDEGRWYEMIATFFQAEFAETGLGGEHELVWLQVEEESAFFHACHAWAVSRVRPRVARNSQAKIGLTISPCTSVRR